MEEYTIECLRRLPLFCGLDAANLVNLADCLERRHFEKEYVLFRQGDPGDVLYIIQSGHVRIVSNKTEDAALVVNHFGPGDVFGEMALVDFGPRSAGAITVTPADLLLLKREHFLHVLAAHPLLSSEIIRGLSAKLRFATSYIEKAITWSQRIARGEYNSAIAAIAEERCAPGGQRSAKEVQIDPLIAAFFSMAEDVRQREEQLKSQLLSLRIEIDAAKRNRQVAEITETEHFRELQAKARSMRGKLSESPCE